MMRDENTGLKSSLDDNCRNGNLSLFNRYEKPAKYCVAEERLCKLFPLVTRMKTLLTRYFSLYKKTFLGALRYLDGFFHNPGVRFQYV